MPNLIDMSRANKMIDFIETLKIPEGMYQGQPFVLREWQKDIIRGVYSPVYEDGFRVVRKAIYSVAKKNGKGLSLDTPLPTPSGWTTMRDVTVNDILYDENGNQCTVLFESDIKNIDCYKVCFSNNDVVICDSEHLWQTTCLIQEPGKFRRLRRKIEKKQVRNIKDIFRTQKCVNGTTNNHSIDVPKPIKCKPKRLPIKPYVLGVWLGDGDSDSARISCGNQDIKDMTTILKKEGISIKTAQETNRPTWRVRLSNGNKKGDRTRKISHKLRKLNLYKNKHIPKYLS